MIVLQKREIRLSKQRVQFDPRWQETMNVEGTRRLFRDKG